MEKKPVAFPVTAKINEQRQIIGYVEALNKKEAQIEAAYIYSDQANVCA